MANWVAELLPELWTPIGSRGVEFCVHRLQMEQNGPVWLWSGMFMIRWKGHVASTYQYQQLLHEQGVKRYVFERTYTMEKLIEEGELVDR